MSIKNKKIFNVLILILSTILIVIACIFVYRSVLDKYKVKHDKDEYEYQEHVAREEYIKKVTDYEEELERLRTEELIRQAEIEEQKHFEYAKEREEEQRLLEEEKALHPDALFTLDDYPKVDASLAIHPLCDAIAKDFLDTDLNDITFSYTTTRTSDVYHNLIDGKCDVILAAEISKEDIEYAKEKNVELEIIPLTSSAFVFIVNTNNPVSNLSLSDIQSIYEGKIKNWSVLGGDNLDIIAYQRPTGSGSQTAMLSLVMKDKEIMNPPLNQIKGEMGMLIDAVADFDDSNQAIGYSYFYYVNTMYKKDTIKMLSVDGVEPTIETIKDGSYPIYTNGFLVFNKKEYDNPDSKVIKWKDALLSERGSNIILDNGYVPVN